MTKHLGEILDGLNNSVGITLKLCGTLALWERVVDERVRKHSKAVKIRNRVLYVSTSSPAWAQELSMLKKDIVEKFNIVAGEEAISDIRFRAI